MEVSVKVRGGSMEASMEVHGNLYGAPLKDTMEVLGGSVEASMEVHGGPWRSPWRSVEAPWRPPWSFHGLP